MNAKEIYWSALGRFWKRNKRILPQIQLQYGRNERWFVREFALAISQHYTGTDAPREFDDYAECEHRYTDISVWNYGTRKEWWPTLVFEAKALYSDDFYCNNERPNIFPALVVATASNQLQKCPLSLDCKRGLFFCIFREQLGKGEDKQTILKLEKQFVDEARGAIRKHFMSDQNIRLTPLSPLTRVRYPDQTWFTSSYISWGTPRRSRSAKAHSAEEIEKKRPKSVAPGSGLHAL
jgi:hypothetical protein